MNFFGHAALAARFSHSPYVVLGSMLPDFCSMLSARLPPLLHPELAIGVALHHATDHLFHDHPEFIAKSRQAQSELLAAGVTRGAARAVSHIGIELLFDEQLAELPEAVSAYRAALGVGSPAAAHQQAQSGRSPAPAGEAVRSELFDDGRLGERLHELLALLLERSYATRPASAEQVSVRIQRALASRPRLALRDERDLAGVQNWVVTTRPRILGCGVQILADLTAALRAQPALAASLAGSSAGRSSEADAETW